ncbi:hypothetical protein HN51_069329 [Arachis hypogaea]
MGPAFSTTPTHSSVGAENMGGPTHPRPGQADRGTKGEKRPDHSTAAEGRRCHASSAAARGRDYEDRGPMLKGNRRAHCEGDSRAENYAIEAFMSRGDFGKSEAVTTRLALKDNMSTDEVGAQEADDSRTGVDEDDEDVVEAHRDSGEVG